MLGFFVRALQASRWMIMFTEEKWECFDCPCYEFSYFDQTYTWVLIFQLLCTKCRLSKVHSNTTLPYVFITTEKVDISWFCHSQMAFLNKRSWTNSKANFWETSLNTLLWTKDTPNLLCIWQSLVSSLCNTIIFSGRSSPWRGGVGWGGGVEIGNWEGPLSKISLATKYLITSTLWALVWV